MAIIFDEYEKEFTPPATTFKDILLFTGISFVCCFLGSIIFLISIFILTGFFEIDRNLTKLSLELGYDNVGPIFPLFLAFITFVILLVVHFGIYSFFHSVDPERYKKTHIHTAQIAIHSFFTFLCMIPFYIYVGIHYYSFLIGVFILHVLLLSLGFFIIIETLNTYRYILLEIYGIFIGTFFSIMLIGILFLMYSSGFAKLLIILFIAPVAYASLVFFKGVFELLYHLYFKVSGYDTLGDIFRQIHEEEKEEERK